MKHSSTGQLERLARLYNVQTAFYGVHRRRQIASAESLLSVIRSLGAPVASFGDVATALREKEQSQRRQILEPVTVAWNGKPPVITITLPSGLAEASCTGYMETESGESYGWKFRLADMPVVDSVETEGCRYVGRKITLPERLPYGYHRFVFEIKGKSCETTLIAAPRRAFALPDMKHSCDWGAFLPLYALKTAGDWGAGDYSGLGALADWVAGEGGRCVGTLPLLPLFLDEPFIPCPYAPVSRLLWNEFYIDVNRVPELAQCPAARELVQSAAFKEEIEGLRGKPLVNYHRIMSLKRRILEKLGKCLVDSDTARLGNFRRFIERNTVVDDYARFRAVTEKQGKTWSYWEPRLRDGLWKADDYDENVAGYYRYAQWLAQEQVRELAANARQRSVALYFDLPLGIHPDGYDAWCHRDIFVGDVNTGAPPDAVFTGGQDWGCPPLHPEKVRAQGYRYVIEYLSHHLRHASMIRIDHVMGLHRLFWIPRGLEAKQGVYVRYQAEELYAILILESHRHRSVIVGEDLGTVPSYVRPAMARHGFRRMYVLHYELADSDKLHHPQRDTVASLNTHDMFPFASFWQGFDILERLNLGLLNEKSAQIEKRNRQKIRNALSIFLCKGDWLHDKDMDIHAVLKACLSFLSVSLARVVLINLEDLWLETQPQNIPGTDDSNPNWHRRARYALEEFCQLPEIRDTLKEVNKLRKKTGK